MTNPTLVLAEGTDRAQTLEIAPHVGKNRLKDIHVMGYVNKMRSSKDELSFISSEKNLEEFEKVLCMVLDVDKGFLDDFTVFELIDAFRRGIEIRTNALKSEDVQEAIKK